MAQGSAKRISGAWQSRMRIARRLVPQLLADLVPAAEVELQRQLALLIYSKPEDVNPRTGRRLWVRTGKLKASERVSLSHQSDVIELHLKNTADYAEPRHEAGKPGRRKTKRPAHWRDETVKVLRLRIRDAARATARKVLSGGP
jgi:hypothetical protein